ncbi:MAG TPA: hypothetical protein IAC04_00805 [Candidatus Coprenecus stercoravium]|uniref:Tetratricopeptide repeat protein n=1 Tax=Candidatus Coprenecus stercoravium TaxID=2840735 RepID=A0A9D2GMX1_9BACT|nr:hypothetical protein [Candidatus Coprenecus stercoravium]
MEVRKENSIAGLEKLLEAYPWYSIARKELFLKMSAMGEEYRRDALHRAVLYLYPDYSVFRRAYILASAGRQDDIPGEDAVYSPEVEEQETGAGFGTVSETAEKADASNRKVYVVGGDYFMPEELKNVQSQDLSSLGVPAPASRTSYGDGSDFTDEAFYTETLARIYADQELYDRANEVYEKLILLYPEKSAYFATLKKDIKKHL